MPQEDRILQAYKIAKLQYADIGVDTDRVLNELKTVAVSLHCWQGDDVVGFEGLGQSIGGGLAVTGNYLGRARTPDELKSDLELAYSLIPGQHRLNLHACYGEFSGKQARRLARMLEETGEQGLYRVVMIHHPPLRGAASPYKRLYGIGRFQKTVLKAGAELVLHGHTHLPTLGYIRGEGRAIPVAGVPAGGQGVGGHKPAGGYTLFDIEGEPGNWRTRMARHALTGQTLGVSEVEVRILEG